MRIKTQYQGNMRWESGEGEARVIMDAGVQVGGKGIGQNPKQMVLQGLAGCTGLDIAAILKKKQVPYELFTIEVNAEQTNTHPKHFKKIDLKFFFKANPDDRKHIERAIELSETQFCGVSHMLKQTAEIKWELEIEPLG